MSIGEINFGTDSQANKKLYNEWAKRYENDVGAWGYDAPERVALMLKEHCSSDQSVVVLDCGCGNGLHGKFLADQGFVVDGIDLSTDMLALARARGCYRNLKNTIYHNH